MILQCGDPRREKYLKGGSVLKKMRNTGGWGKGVMAGGAVFLIFGILLGGIFMSLIIGGFFGLPGLLLIVAGKMAQDKKMKNYLKYYEKETGFDEQELQLVEQELMSPDMVMFGNVPEYEIQGISEKNPQIPCMITRHYFVAPMVLGESYIRRNSDMILAAYSQEIPGTGGYRHGLVFLSKRDDDAWHNGLLTRDVCMEIIETLKERQPNLITGQRFVYQDKPYNVLNDGPRIVRMFQKQDSQI